MSRDFDGVDDYIDWGQNTGLGFIVDVSYSAWIQYDTLTATFYSNVITAHGGIASNYAYYFWIDDAKFLRLFWSYGFGTGVDVVSTGASTIAAGVWTQVGFTRNWFTKTVKFYVNGVQLGTDVAYSDNPDGGTGSSLFTGADPASPATYHFDGRIAEEATWDEVMDATVFTAIGAGGTPLAASAYTPIGYRRLSGERAGLEYDQNRAQEDGVVFGAVKGATNPPVRQQCVRSARGRASTYGAFALNAGGRARVAMGTYALSAPGRHRFTLPYSLRARGQASTLNPFTRNAVGGHRVAYTPYGGSFPGLHTRYEARTLSGRGSHRTGIGSYTLLGRGAHGILAGYQLAGRGVHAGYMAASRTERGGSRVANAALDRYELYRGIDAPPDLTAAPWQTFTAPPFTTPALAAGHTYRFVLRRRNAWGLLSQNTVETAVVVAGDGSQTSAPSAPTSTGAAAAAAGAVLVTAEYAYDADGAAQADAFLVYVRTNGTNPDPSVDTPVVVAMGKADGVAKLEYTTAAQAEGTTVKALVRTRRSGTPNVDSTNATPIVSAVATLLGPAAVAPGALLQGRLLEQAQEEAPLRVGGLTLWLRADSIGAAGVADGGGVSNWASLSGNGYAFAQLTAGNQPLYRAAPAGLNGRPAVQFDGVDDILFGSAPGLTNTVRRTVFVVAKLSSNLAATGAILANGTADWYVGGSVGSPLNRTFTSHRNAALAQKTLGGSPGVFSSSAFAIAAYRWETSGSNVTVEHFFNGAANGSSVMGDGYGPVNSATFYVGGFFPSTLLWPGWVAEVLAYDSAIPDADRKAVEAYLGERYGITVS